MQAFEFQKYRPYIGHTDQLFSLRKVIGTQGRANGMRMIEADNGAGLQFTILPDRCLDLYQVKFMGRNLNYIAPVGMSAPSHFDEDRFLKNFFAGFLSTCGLSNIGLPSEDEGETFEQHGTVGNIPAEEVSARVEFENGTPVLKISGLVRQASLYSTKLLLRREYTCVYGSNELRFTDTIVNEDYKAVPYMLLYHMNMGFPLLSEHAKLLLPSRKQTPRTAHAATALERWSEVLPPQETFEEMCYYHEMEKDADGKVTYGVENPEIGTRLEITYDGNLLDHFVQWKMYGRGEYVTGLEPANASIEGRHAAREDGSLKFLPAGGNVAVPFVIRLSTL